MKRRVVAGMMAIVGLFLLLPNFSLADSNTFKLGTGGPYLTEGNNTDYTYPKDFLLIHRFYVEGQPESVLFCLNSDIHTYAGNTYVSSGEVDNMAISWLLRQFNEKYPTAPTPDHQTKTFNNDYAATQIAIWNNTNPQNEFVADGADIYKMNPDIRKLVKEAKTHINDQTTKQYLDSLTMNIQTEVTSQIPEKEYSARSNVSIAPDKKSAAFDINIDYEHPTLYLITDDKKEDITKHDDVYIALDEKSHEISVDLAPAYYHTLPAGAVISLSVQSDVTAPNNVATFYDTGNGPAEDQQIGQYYSHNISTSVASADDLTIPEPEKVEITGKKIWDDKGNQDGKRPDSITVQLYANGKLTDEQSVTEENDWTYHFTDLLKYQDGQIIDYTVKEAEVPGYTSTIDGTDIINHYTPETIAINGQKQWDDENDQDGLRPSEIKVNLLADGTVVQTQVVTTQNNWAYQFTELPKYKDGQEITYTVDEESVPAYESTVEGMDLVNVHTPELTEISGKKVWDDQNNQDGKRPASIIVNLLANGVVVDTKEVTEADDWAYSFTELPKYQNGEELTYTVTEEHVPDYSVSIDGTSINNQYTPGKTSVTVTKAWDDQNNQDGLRPAEIKVQLYGNGQKVGAEIALKEENDWTHTWVDLPEKEKGETVHYTVKEVTETKAYDATVNDDDSGNILLTNHHTPETTELHGTKTWADENDQDGKRPAAIKVNLLADGTIVANKTVNANDQWRYSFTDLPKYQNGQEITYTVSEEAVSGYESSIEGTDITNKYVPETTDISGKKIWDDQNNQDGKRPEHITIHLLANGEVIDSQVVSAKDDWVYSFTQLPKYENGVAIVYTLTEDQVPDYSTSINGSSITNQYTPGKTSVTVTKAWDDQNNQDGLRPNTIHVQLMGNQQKVGEPVALNTSNQWTYTWTALPEKEDGSPIIYTVEEIDTIDGYDGSVDDKNHGNIVLTNSHEPELTDISGQKTWKDHHDQDGKRPHAIVVNLLADGQQVDSKKVTAENDWAYAFTQLPKYENGRQINYTVTENTIPDYSTTINGTDIINAYTPNKTSVTVTKTWQDQEDQDGLRPKEIHVQLMANGKEVGEPISLNEDNQWRYTWQELDEKADGETIHYTVKEIDTLEGYGTTINDTDQGNILLTNSHVPERTEISGTKTWQDDENQAGKRPTSITVYLLANGVVVDQTSVTEKDAWHYQFTDLPKYQAGEPIVYTLAEASVANYTTTINGVDITNRYTPNKTSVTVIKAWQDNQDQDGLRPSSIEVQLYANDKAQGEPVILDAKNQWTTTWTDLAVNESDQPIHYAVKEVSVSDGYEASIDNQDQGNIIITNSHTPSRQPDKYDPSHPNNEGNFPKTGSEANGAWILIGILIIGIVVGVEVRRMRK